MTNFSLELLTSKHMFLSHYYLLTLNIPKYKYDNGQKTSPNGDLEAILIII